RAIPSTIGTPIAPFRMLDSFRIVVDLFDGLFPKTESVSARRFLDISRPVALGYHRDSLAATLTQAAIRTRWSLPFDAKKGSASLRSASAPGLQWAGTMR